MKYLLRILMIAIVVVVIVDISASFYFYHVAIERTSKDFLKQSPAAANFALAREPVKWKEEPDFEDLTLLSQDGLELHGYYLPAATLSKKTVIIAHGFAGKAHDMDAYAAFYHDQQGFNVLMTDARGHGQSTGDYIGYGWDERRDYVEWIGLILQKVGADSEIVLHGGSMGAATVLMTSGESLPPNVKAIISDSAYTSAEAELTYALGRMYHLAKFPIVQSTSLLTKLRAGYFIGEASALKQVKKSKTPILFIHGTGDLTVPLSMAYELYEACESPKELYVVEGAKHGKSYYLVPVSYEKKITEFLKAYVQL
ncbi:alpha/beta hydrolase [Paenibacillus sp. N3.4]|uniref:alpha/beta hydrolase n=1 Tax=Paenibacillus sp. N3.4 TaxID=2603222 RepID=UPI0011C7C10A|nr:alpha/beta hydrolase [Paenibacillus sp. N3.4]TXK83983.1 alpha/beta hydrolase [Paenibacillus sp. N3.4]